MLNGTAFPLFNALMPYVAKEVYNADQTTLSYLFASGAFGSLLGSIAMSRHGAAPQPARMMIVCAAAWYAMLAVFAHVPNPNAGLVVLVLAGIAQSACLVPMSTILLRNSEAKFRGRIMGIRMLALYANLPGLLIAGPLITRFGYPVTATLYTLIAIGLTLVIALRWRACLWQPGAPANR
jgi:MFS family permease